MFLKDKRSFLLATPLMVIRLKKTFAEKNRVKKFVDKPELR
jgi:hypothetical protein